MAKVFDAHDPGFRLLSAIGIGVLGVALLVSGALRAAEVEINLDVLKTLPAAKSGEASKTITLTPPTAKKQTIGRREEALRRARKNRLIEQAKRKAAARKAAAKKRADAARKAEDAKRAEDAKQAAEIDRQAKAEREAEAARKAKAAKTAEAEAAKAAEAKAKRAEAARKAAKAAAERKAAEAASERKSAKAAVKTAEKPKTKAADKKQLATRTARLPLSRARLLFGKESAALSKTEKQKLEPIAARMISEEKALLVIYAYATGDGSNTSDARRLSLSRALAVRQAIIGRGIPAIRTEIRALGDKAGPGPSDRVDLVLVQR